MSTASTSTLGAGSNPPQSLLKFCLLWTVLHRSSPPEVCNSVADYHQEDLEKVFFNQHDLLQRLQHRQNSFNNHHDILDPNSNSKTAGKNSENAFQFHFKHSSRSLSVIGVLGGIVLILFFVALSTCIKHRRNVNAFGDRYHHRENLAREMLVDHIRQLRSNYRGGESQRSNQDRPPSYDDVVKDPAAALADEVDSTSEDPPSYIEATNFAASVSGDVNYVPGGATSVSGDGNSTSGGSISVSGDASSLNLTEESQSQNNMGTSLTTIVTVETHTET